MLTHDTNPFPRRSALRRWSGPSALVLIALALAACSSAAPLCDDEETLGALQTAWTDHAILLPSGGALGTGSFRDIRDISEEVEDLPDGARACEVEVFDLGGRVIHSVYHAVSEGIIIKSADVIERFNPPQ